ncbi:MAG: hypothetical protein ABI837_17800, partial [Acidobacteriota bacterium]
MAAHDCPVGVIRALIKAGLPLSAVSSTWRKHSLYRGSSRFVSAQYWPWELIHGEKYKTYGDARRRESDLRLRRGCRVFAKTGLDSAEFRRPGLIIPPSGIAGSNPAPATDLFSLLKLGNAKLHFPHASACPIPIGSLV